MKTKSIMIILLLIQVLQAKSQVKILYCGEEPGLITTYMDISKFNVVDTTNICVTYQVAFCMNPSRIDSKSKDMMRVDIGNKFAKCYSLNMYLNDSICTELSKKSLDLPINDDLFFSGEIFKNNMTGKARVINRMPYSNNLFEYEEDNPTIQWNILGDTATVIGYKCRRAEGELFGRKYCAWFTTDIPVSEGPWKLSGLPGLILKASDADDNFVFEAVAFNQNRCAIKEYMWKSKKVSKKEWTKMDIYCHNRAADYMKINNVNYKIVKGNDMVPMPDNWQAPYNPIER